MGNLGLKITDLTKHISQPAETTSRYSDAEKSKIANTAKQFESLLTSMMLKSMNKTTQGMFGDNSLGGDIYGSIFEMELASDFSKSRSFGVAEMVYKKVTGEDMTNDLKLPLNKALPFDTKSLKDEIKKAIKIDNTTPLNLNNSSAPIKPGSKSLERINKYDGLIEKAAKKYGVDKNLIKSVILTESAGKENAVSSAKAKGLMQLMDQTAKDLGVENVWDPGENIMGGTKYLAEMLRQYNGDINLALAGYNAGPGNVDKFNGVPPFEETKNYITRVTGYLNHLNGL